MEQIKAGLLERRQVLSDELGRLTEPPVEGSNVGFGKRVGEGTTEAVERISSTAAARSIASSIADIDHALDRLDEGVYGLCEICGEPIPEERLTARPATARCISCAS